MSKVLILTGLVVGTFRGEAVRLGPSEDVNEITLPDKKYGLKQKDVDRIVRAGAGRVEETTSKKSSKSNKPGPEPTDPVEVILSHSVDDIEEILSAMKDDELAAVKEGESAKEKPRVTLLDAIEDEEQLRKELE